MKDVVAAVRATSLMSRSWWAGLPVTADYAASIGADGYVPDAATAVAVAKAAVGMGVCGGDGAWKAEI
ncbi:MAG: hypothetical protein M5T61_19825 [Acidimicrobiia bacterium]|nr:hypothetical protein [Acidimicrobiia bacterium]